ncbi:MAG TPA: dienelactone hydrolase family protein [Chloroflexia bacterium]|nr:dienelactone hydrolase family protein [Chloroflexia bacterium]
MDTRTYEDFHAEVMALYNEQKYGEMYDLLTAEGERFTDRAQEYEVLYLRSCMAARTGQTELALSLIRESLDRGLWHGEEVLRRSPSWQSLQGNPEFERLAEESIKMSAAAYVGPQMEVVEPEGGCLPMNPCPVVIALHGNGSNIQQTMRGWRPALDMGWALAALQSSQMSGPTTFIWDNQETALRELGEHYAALVSGHSVDPKRVVLAGFSMGGETALRAALTGTIPVKGFVLLGPGGPSINDSEPEVWAPLIEKAAGRGLRGYVMFGEADDTIPHDGIRRIVEMLNEGGIPTGLEVIPNTRHEYPPDFADYARRALEHIEA